MRANKRILTIGTGTLCLTLAAGAIIAAAPSPAPAPAPATAARASFVADAVHSGVVFSVMHAQATRFYGRFNKITGDFTLDGDDAAASSFNFEVDLDSVYTGNANRDQHLKSADFFNVAQFPAAKFTSSSVKATGDGAWEVTGALSLHGQTRDVTATLEKTGEGTFRGNPVTGIEARFTIKRSGFGMTYGIEGGGLGDEVTVIVSIEGREQ